MASKFQQKMGDQTRLNSGNLKALLHVQQQKMNETKHLLEENKFMKKQAQKEV